MKPTWICALAAILLPMLATASPYRSNYDQRIVQSLLKQLEESERDDGSGGAPPPGPPAPAPPAPGNKNEDVVVPLPACNDQYRALGDNTICRPPSKLLKSGGVSKEQQQQIVKLHNDLRAQPDPRNLTIFGVQMQAMVWDDNIAVIAQALANTCVFDHDNNRNVIGYGYSIGQNLAAGYGTWESAIKGWFGEVEDFALGNGSINGKAVGHYTAMTKEDSSRIGCGFASCRNKDDEGQWPYYVCNYAKCQSNYKTPFKPGPYCGSCPDTCKNRLCDCQGKICENDGVLDVNTCVCKCPQLWSGSPSCSKLMCPADDHEDCTQYEDSDCKTYSNVPVECPYKCGLCKKPARRRTL